eukprot:g64155.t1
MCFLTEVLRKDIQNPVDAMRAPSTVYINNPAGVGHFRSMLTSPQAWSAAINDLNQFIVLDLGRVFYVSGVVTQGRADLDQWVNQYAVETSLDKATFTPVGTFSGNMDRNTQINRMFPSDVAARYVKFIPRTWTNWISMRLAVVARSAAYSGCFANNVPNLQSGHVWPRTVSQCADQSQFFGMEWPACCAAAGDSACLSLSGLPAMVKVADSECQAERDSEDRLLGGTNRLAVYTQGLLSDCIFTEYSNAFLPTFAGVGKVPYTSLDEAKQACCLQLDCGGISQDTLTGQTYTLRRGAAPQAFTGSTSWVKIVVGQWHLAPAGAATCDYGVNALQSECQAVVAQLASENGKTPGTWIQNGPSGTCGDNGWGAVPLGCSAQTGGSWTAHFKASGVNCPTTTYSLVCSGPDGYHLVAREDESGFNSLFQSSPDRIIRRVCPTCVATHREIFYRRRRFDQWNAYSNMWRTWSITAANANVPNVDFGLYSSLSDALANVNPWQFCNGDDPGVGFPRDCGPQAASSWQFNSLTRGGPEVFFYIYRGIVTCNFAVDDITLGVWYNGVNVMNTVTGDLGKWDAVKTVKFEEVIGASLAIQGLDAQSSPGPGTCGTAGLLLSCTSVNPQSAWHGLVSDLSGIVKAFGTPQNTPPYGWTSNSFDDSSFTKLCPSTSGFSMPGSGTATKVWASDKYGYFLVNPDWTQEFPPPRTSTPTAWSLTTFQAEINSAPYGNGIYKASCSPNWGGWPSTGAFDKTLGVTAGNNGWHISAGETKLTAWLQIELPAPIVLAAIAIQARSDCCFDQTPNGFVLQASSNGVNWVQLHNQPGGSNYVSAGEQRRYAISSSGTPYRFFRLTGFINTQQYVSMSEWRLYRAPPMDIKNLVDAVRTPSTVFNNDPAGVGHFRSMLDSPQAWSAAINDLNQFIVLDLGGVFWVPGVVTQGRTDQDQWVTQYAVETSLDKVTFTPVGTFSGNVDRNTQVNRMFPNDVAARYVKFIPRTWTNWISMRLAVLTESVSICPSDFPFYCKQSWNGKVCYNVQSYATACSGEFGTWCALSGASSDLVSKFPEWGGKWCSGAPLCPDYLAYCNAYQDLKNAFCGGATCTTAAQSEACRNHWQNNGRNEYRTPNPENCVNPILCTCNTPGEGTANYNGYSCNDRTSGFCAANEECYATQPFRKGAWGLACRIPDDEKEFPPVTVLWSANQAQVSNAAYGNGIYRASSSSAFNGNWPPQGAFDKATTGSYVTTGFYGFALASGVDFLTSWLQLELPVQLVISAVAITARYDCCLDQSPTSCSVQGSNDGTNWAPIRNIPTVGFSTLGEQRRFEIPSVTTAYRFFRLTGFTSTTSVVSFGEWQLYGKAFPLPSPTSSGSPTISLSASRSFSPTISVSASISLSASPTISLSASPTISLSASRSVSPTTSLSTSPSGSPTISVSPTNSISLSASRSASPTISVSPTNSPPSSRSASPTISASPKWHLAPVGAVQCDYGETAAQSDCPAAVAFLASQTGRTPGRSLQVGNGGTCGNINSGWGNVPVGCSAQTGADWAPHFKSSGVSCNIGYRLICSG